MTTKTIKTVTVERRGGFHDDSFFKDSWGTWDNAMKDVVCKYDPAARKNSSTVTKTTTTTSKTSQQPQTAVSNLDNQYRQIRTSNLSKDESQAVSCVEDNCEYKMVVDAKDYKPDEINVKVTDDNVIVVEGKIERKEGNSTSSQSFTRRFMLPGSIVDFTKVSSALSKDGVLKIIAPKKASAVKPAIKSSTPTGRRSVSQTPSTESEGSSYTGSSYTGSSEPSSEREVMVPVHANFTTHGMDEFDAMVEKSHEEMQKMMERHSLHTAVSNQPTILIGPPSRNLVAAPSKGVSSNKEVIKKGDAITEREEKRWEDSPAPGVKRQHHSVTEQTKLKGHDGSPIGTQERRKQESEASGGHEEILPDGTKRKVFTKSYETRQVFTSSSTDPKSK